MIGRPSLGTPTPGRAGACGSSRHAGPAGNIAVYVRGDSSPKGSSDGLAGQTPSEQVFTLRRLELLRSPGDPNPVVAFDHGPSDGVPVDMLAESPTLVGRAHSSLLPAGTHTHGRVDLRRVRTTIAATAHLSGLKVSARVTIDAALGDTEVDGDAWPKGTTSYTFTAGRVRQSFRGPAPSSPQTPGGATVTDASTTWLVFPFTTPFVIDPDETEARSTTATDDVFGSLRWEDLASADYATGVFDVEASAGSTEPVRGFGVTAYRTE